MHAPWGSMLGLTDSPPPPPIDYLMPFSDSRKMPSSGVTGRNHPLPSFPLVHILFCYTFALDLCRSNKEASAKKFYWKWKRLGSHPPIGYYNYNLSSSPVCLSAERVAFLFVRWQHVRYHVGQRSHLVNATLWQLKELLIVYLPFKKKIVTAQSRKEKTLWCSVVLLKMTSYDFVVMKEILHFHYMWCPKKCPPSSDHVSRLKQCGYCILWISCICLNQFFNEVASASCWRVVLLIYEQHREHSYL